MGAVLHKAEIESDLARGDPDDLKDAFDALVAWNDASTVVGVASAADMMDLFRRVCGAMLACADRVPPDTVRALARGRGDLAACLPTTYGDAARLALAAHRTWWPAFSTSFRDESDR